MWWVSRVDISGIDATPLKFSLIKVYFFLAFNVKCFMLNVWLDFLFLKIVISSHWLRFLWFRFFSQSKTKPNPLLFDIFLEILKYFPRCLMCRWCCVRHFPRSGLHHSYYQQPFSKITFFLSFYSLSTLTPKAVPCRTPMSSHKK